jgi:hypothetical protein
MTLSTLFAATTRQRAIRGLAAGAFCLGLLGGASAQAETPGLIGYQAAVFDDQGQPAVGPVDVDVAIFDAASGGSERYAESHLGVTLVDGAFDIQIGAGTSPSGTLDADTFAASETWLELSIDGEVLDPRQRLVAVPYALRAAVAERLDGAIGSVPYADIAGHASTADTLASPITPGEPRDLLRVATDTDPGYLGDGARVHWQNSFFPEQLSADALVFEKTDGDDAIPDGGFAFTNRTPWGVETSMVIRGDGKVGIGTLSPTHPLHVVGGARVEVNGAGEKALVEGNSNRALLFVNQLGSGEAFEAVGSGSGSARATIRAENHNLANGNAAYFVSQGWGAAAYIHNSGVGPALYLDNGGEGDFIAVFDPTLPSETSKRFWVDDQGVTNVRTLKIHGGADLSESFDVTPPAPEFAVEPGTIVAIDPVDPGKLVVSEGAYNRTVAGVVAGAGGIQPGMLLRQEGVAEADGEHPVALTGRVYAKADTTNGPIRPGDLLTTSDRPGHAMKASDWQRSQGAVLGKAMSNLDQDTGLVLVLVGLQ